MDSAAMLAELEAVAADAGVAVVYDRFTGEGTRSGGVCRVRDQWRIMVERRAQTPDKMSLLAAGLAELIAREEVRIDLDALTTACGNYLRRHLLQAEAPPVDADAAAANHNSTGYVEEPGNDSSTNALE